MMKNFLPNDNNSKNKEYQDIEINNSKYTIRTDEISIKEESPISNLQKIVRLGLKNFQHVTVSHENCHKESEERVNKNTNIPKIVINEILDIIKNENGLISLGYTLQLACKKSQIVRDFVKDEKLTSRESRKVRNLFVEIIRHPNIKVLKNKPELVVKWIKDENEKEMINT